MDRITLIESKITAALQKIDGTTQSTGYKYYTNTGQVQVFDEVVAIARNVADAAETNKSVNHTFEPDENLGLDISIGQKAMTNTMKFILKSKLFNVAGTNPKAEMRQKMNECLSDLLFVFGNDYHLDNTVQVIEFVSSERMYEDITNNRIQSGTLQTDWLVTYSQSINNPDLQECW